MNNDEQRELESSLNDIDFGITENDGALGRFTKRLLKGVVKKCLKDRSGAAFYKLSDTLMSIVPGENPRDLVSSIDNGFLCNNSKSLHQVYKCLDRVATNHPEQIDDVIKCIIKRSKQKENDEKTIKDVFFLCEKIKVQKPEYQNDLLEIKREALNNLCLNHPAKGMMVISSLISETYPTKDDLSIIYDGLSTMLSKSDLSKQAYPPIIKLLEECSKSGYNVGDNMNKVKGICDIIKNKNSQYKEQAQNIENNVMKQQNFSNRVIEIKKGINRS